MTNTKFPLITSVWSLGVMFGKGWYSFCSKLVNTWGIYLFALFHTHSVFAKSSVIISTYFAILVSDQYLNGRLCYLNIFLFWVGAFDFSHHFKFIQEQGHRINSLFFFSYIRRTSFCVCKNTMNSLWESRWITLLLLHWCHLLPNKVELRKDLPKPS